MPAISSKLIRPESRSSLANQHRYWNKVIQIEGSVRCPGRKGRSVLSAVCREEWKLFVRRLLVWRSMIYVGFY